MTPFPALTAQSPAPQPTEMELWEVTPGIEGFFWGFFLLAIIVIPLFISMNRHMRKVDHNERLRRQAEEAAQERQGPADDPRVIDAQPPGPAGPAALEAGPAAPSFGEGAPGGEATAGEGAPGGEATAGEGTHADDAGPKRSRDQGTSAGPAAR
ncbi:hypothetical protein [Georgenia sp. AZ-5]|uniref:hypothetical protein n=1 Tax=Georgenia sp. AZ-5 TaxID=3367526 RepID=UPI003754DF3C